MIDAEYYKGLPKKRMGAGALFFDISGKLLIVKPIYKDHWSIPGGVVEGNESPRDACIREVKEEIGLKIEDLRFLCVEYYQNENDERGDSLQFMFGAKSPLTEQEITCIRLQESEIGEYKFCTIEDALKLVSKKMAARIKECLPIMDTDGGLYLESGKF